MLPNFTIDKPQCTAAPALSVYRQTWGADRHISPSLLDLNTAPWDGIDDVSSQDGQVALHSLLEWLETAKPYRIGSHGREQYITEGVNRLAAKYSSDGLFIEGINPQTGQPSGDRQLRLEHPPQNGPKYLRPPGVPAQIFFAKVDEATCSAVAARYEVEDVPTPEGFWEWVKAHKLPWLLVEGAGDALGALSNGYVAVGAPGHHMCFKPGTRELKPELQWLASGGGACLLAFDQDAKPQTIREVNFSRVKTGKAIGIAGAKVHVLEWDNAKGKGFGDLSPDAQAQAIDRAIPFPQWRVKGYSLFTRQPSLEINQRYLSVEYPRNFLTLVKSAKGTGKTEALIKAVAKAHDEGRRVLLLTHRVQLGQAICDRVGLPYITEVRSAGEGSALGYGLCVDSLHPNSRARFHAEDWRDALVIIDEVEQVLWHLFHSSTCKEAQRAIILQQFIAVLQGAGQVIALDADLSDITAAYMEQVTGHEAYTIINRWKPSGDEAWDGYLYEKPVELLQKLDQDMRQQRRCFVVTQSQKPKSPYGTINLEKHCRKSWPTARILRIDSDTVADPNHPAFGCIGALNDIFGQYDIVIASPVLETGASIDIRGHFEGVYAFLPGQTPENSARQTLARVREPVPRYIWAASYGSTGTIHGGELSPRALLGKLGARAQKALQLLEWDDATDCLDLHSESLELWAKMAARINGGLIGLRDTLTRNLEDEGHRLHCGGIDISKPFTPSEKLKDEVQTTRDESWDEECEAVAGEAPLSDSEAEKLNKKRSLTQQQRRQLRKHKLGKLYGVDVTPDLVKSDDEGLYPKLRLQYFLTLGNAHLPQRDKATAETMLENGGGKMWLPDFTGSMYGVRVAVLKALELEQWLGDFEREFRSSDPDLKAWADRVIDCRQQVKRLLGISISPKTPPVRVLKQVLSLIGVELRCMGRDKVDGKARDRFYCIVPPPDLHTAILQAWLTADDVKAAKTDPDPIQTQTPQGLAGNMEPLDPDSIGSRPGNRSYISNLDPDPIQTQTPPTSHPHPTLVEWDGEWWWQCGDRILPSAADPDTTPLEDWLTLQKTA